MPGPVHVTANGFPNARSVTENRVSSVASNCAGTSTFWNAV
ncbi:MAG TPA: hypothetical protein VNQ77_00355 [Frankiaceae bacterium]|nr:hypothetical protein [Frankiaceae bacterium]